MNPRMTVMTAAIIVKMKTAGMPALTIMKTSITLIPTTVPAAFKIM